MKRNTKIIILVGVGLFILGALLSCNSNRITANKFIGKWEIDYTNSSSAYNDKMNNLTLNEDGTFVWDYNSTTSPSEVEHIAGDYEILPSKIKLNDGNGTDYMSSFEVEGNRLVYAHYTELKKVDAFSKTNIYVTPENNASQTTPSTNPTVTILSEADKKALKTKVSDALKDYNATAIDILTSSKDGSPIANVQLESLFSFDQINENEIVTFVDTITSLIEPISINYRIALIDSNSQLILTKSNDSEIQYAQGVQPVN